MRSSTFLLFCLFFFLSWFFGCTSHTNTHIYTGVQVLVQEERNIDVADSGRHPVHCWELCGFMCREFLFFWTHAPAGLFTLHIEMILVAWKKGEKRVCVCVSVFVVSRFHFCGTLTALDLTPSPRVAFFIHGGAISHLKWTFHPSSPQPRCFNP